MSARDKTVCLELSEVVGKLFSLLIGEDRIGNKWKKSPLLCSVYAC